LVSSAETETGIPEIMGFPVTVLASNEYHDCSKLTGLCKLFVMSHTEILK
jgi:hypothetical protein